MESKSKRKLYNKNQFSDKQAYDEIKEDIRDIRDRNLKQVQEEKQIMKLYEQKKKQLKRRKMEQREEKYKTHKSKKETNKSTQKYKYDLGQEDQQEGQISDHKNQGNPDNLDEDYQQMPSIRNLGQHIRPITLTRNKVCSMLMSRKFQDYVKGCFVRYKSESSSSNTNSYLLAQIIGVVEGNKEYTLGKNTKTKKILKLQQSSEQFITLSIQLLSNQHPPGALQISAWIRTNRNNIPKQKQLKQKLDELNRLMYGKISSEDIDKSIYQQALSFAQNSTQIKGDISKYIFFIQGQLHDINMSIEEAESKQSREGKMEAQKLLKKKQKHEQILTKLRKKRAQLEQQKAPNKKNQTENNKKALHQFSEIFFDDRKDDKVNQKVKQKLSVLSSHEGLTRVLKETQDAHKNYKFDIQI